MRGAILISIAMIFLLIGLALETNCNSASDQAATADNFKQLARSHIGRYQSTVIAPEFITENASGEIPTIDVLPDGTFKMWAIPAKWLPTLLDQKVPEHSLEGSWSPGDDGDGSLVLFLQIASADGVKAQKKLMARVGDGDMYFDDVAIPHLKMATHLKGAATAN